MGHQGASQGPHEWAVGQVGWQHPDDRDVCLSWHRLARAAGTAASRVVLKHPVTDFPDSSVGVGAVLFVMFPFYGRAH